jgi:iron complex outermembrane recepter protein
MISDRKKAPPTLQTASVLLLTGLFYLTPRPICAADNGVHSIQESTLETVTVTAQKREENVQEITTSITVLSDTAIEDAQIESTKDLSGYVPNLRILKGGSRDYFSRIGVRGISNTGIGDPAVALYIDDVSYAGVYAFDSSLFDIERIEVLKGPQGTLYGKNTEGGAINIITKSPENTFDAKVSLETGTYNTWHIDGLINAPLVEDTLFLRIAALKSTRDGYIKNLYNGENIDNQDTTSANASLLFTPLDNLDFNLTFRINDFDDDGGFPMVSMEKSKYKAATGLTSLDDFEASYNYSGESSSKNNTTSLRIKYEQDYFDLISVTGYRNMDNKSSLDADFTPSEMFLGFNAVESESITQELRLLSKDSNESFKWLVGLYYGDDTKDHNTGYKLDRIYAEMMGVPIYTEDTHSATMGAEDTAVFGQSTVRFFGDALGLTAGLRYERSKRTMDKQHTFGGVQTVAPMNDLKETYSELLPKLAIDYLLRDGIMSYFSVAKGYKAGGFSYAVDNPELVYFDPEVSLAFELGLKTEFPEQGLRLNVAAFYTEVDDYQDRVQIDPMTIIQANATKTNIYGFELEASYALTDTLSFNGILGYTNAKYDEYIDPMTLANNKGNNVTLVPEYDLGLFLEYRNQLGIFARAEMQNTGTSYFDRANTQKQSAYSLYNIKVGYEQNDWDIYLSVKNATNEQYFLDAFEDSTLGYMGTVGDPRTINLIFNYRF